MQSFSSCFTIFERVPLLCSPMYIFYFSIFFNFHSIFIYLDIEYLPTCFNRFQFGGICLYFLYCNIFHVFSFFNLKFYSFQIFHIIPYVSICSICIQYFLICSIYFHIFLYVSIIHIYIYLKQYILYI